MTPRTVLITGASGRIGQLLANAWKDRYTLSLLDLRPQRDGVVAPVTQGDASSLARMRSLCIGVDTVVHLAGLPSPRSDWRSLRHHNVRSAWAVLKAARDAGCQRVVFASSVMTMVDPDLPYSRAKRLGEQLGERYASSGTLSVLSLRVGHVLARRDRQLWPDARHMPWALMEADLISAFTLAVDAPAAVQSGIYTIVSAGRPDSFDIGPAHEFLGYSPTMNPSSLAERNYQSTWGWLKRAKRRARRLLARDRSTAGQ